MSRGETWGEETAETTLSSGVAAGIRIEHSLQPPEIFSQAKATGARGSSPKVPRIHSADIGFIYVDIPGSCLDIP